MKMGAHVFVEKPTSHTIGESQAMLKVSRDRTDGSGRSSSPDWPTPCFRMDFLKSGRVGRIGMVRMFVNSSGSGPEEPSAHSQVPRGMDWDRCRWACPVETLLPQVNPGRMASFSRDYANGTLGTGAFTGSIKCFGGVKNPIPKPFSPLEAAPSRALLSLIRRTVPPPMHLTHKP